MKKTFKTFTLMLLTAFALSSCVDVPAPFNLPDKSSSSDGGGSSSNEGTPVTCAQAVELTNALADGATSSEVYTITGYITEVIGAVSRNQQTFWLADAKNGGKVFEAYYANLPEGVTAFTVGTKVKITGKLMKFVNNSGQVTPEIKNAIVEILADDGGGGGGTEDEDAISVSCVIAAQMTADLPDNTSSAETYAITGYITKVIGAVSTKTGTPQQSFWMADKMADGEVFQAYYANLPEGVSEFTVGMKVKITGKLYNFTKSDGSGAAEMKNPTVVILSNDGGDGGDGGDTPPVGDVIDVTCTEAVELTNALDNGATSTETYAVTGYITEVIGSVSRNQQTFWMADTKDGGRVFEAFYANLPEGVSAFTAGAKVKITGQLLKYVNTSGQVTPEIKNANVVILEQGDGGQGGGGDDTPPTPGPGGDEVTELVNGDFEEWVSDSEPTGWKSASTASNAVLSKSSDARGGSFSCKVGAPGSANKRLATQEITLEPGTYTFSFYAKSTTADKSQTKCGYVPVADGAVGAYKYGDFFNLNNNGWTLVSYEFTLEATTTVCLVVMNPKDSNYSKSQDILVDDATLVKK